MTELSTTKKTKERTITIPICLKTGHAANQPSLANYTHASLAQGLAYVDFGFVEPSLIGAFRQSAREGEVLPKHVEGTCTTRVALPLDALLRLQQQLAQVVIGLQRKPTAQP